MDSLQSLCLKLIVNNFEQFHFLFTISKDARLQRNMQFLQRRFSDYLATELLKDQKETDTYFDFLINEHLSKFNFPWYRSSRYLNSDDNIFQRLPNLRSITFYSHGDQILESIAKFCPRIVNIHDLCSTVTDKGIKYLCEAKNGLPPCPQLEEILISCSTESVITDEAIACLIQNVPSLEFFNHPKLPLMIYNHVVSDGSKSRYFNITQLDFDYCANYYSIFTRILKTCLSACPKLTFIACPLFKKEQLDALTNSHLKMLMLRFYGRLKNSNIDNFLKSSGRNLNYLGIVSCTVSISALLLYCPHLEQLHTSCVNITGDLHTQAFFQYLKSYTIWEHSSAIVEKISLISSYSPKLECVTFEYCSFSSEIRRDILIWCKSSVVKEITFSHIHLEIDFLKDFILNCHSLKYLYLKCCKYNVHYPERILKTLIENLRNKPKIKIDGIEII